MEVNLGIRSGKLSRRRTQECVEEHSESERDPTDQDGRAQVFVLLDLLRQALGGDDLQGSEIEKELR